MSASRHMRRVVALLAAVAALAASCGGDDEPATTGAPAATDAPATAPADTVGSETTASESTAPPETAPTEILTDIGVTEEPCPDAVNPDNGCIYLGLLVDLTGPTAPQVNEIVQGVTSFWASVNDAGGIAGQFDVDVKSNVYDTVYDPQQHVVGYNSMKNSVLALAISHGSSHTLAILEDLEAESVLAVPSSFSSVWGFEDNILETGYSYCVEAMNGVDYAVDNGDVSSVLAASFPGDLGSDVAAGIKAAAEANGIEFTFVQATPSAGGATQDPIVESIMQANPDVVYLAVTPSAAVEIIAKSVARGYGGRFVSSLIAWSSAIMTPDTESVLAERLVVMRPYGIWDTESDAHAEMQAAFGEGQPQTEWWLNGWMWEYPLLSALEAAAASGDLTRAGMAAALDGLEIDYRGALPNLTVGGNPNEELQRFAKVYAPDPANVQKLSLVEESYTGRTAADHQFGGPCGT